MVSIPPEFPPPPTPFQRIGWRGFSLLLPHDWNLRLHDGDDRKGALVFADLRSPRLELRWQTPRNPQAAVQKSQKSLCRKTSSAQAHLIAFGRRLYELHFPTPIPADLVNTITTDFRATLPLLDQCPDTFWSLYGLSAWLPKAATLQSVSLLPGQTTLTFHTPRSTLTLASLSLADRHLRQKSLRQWAGQHLPDLTRHPKAAWQESPLTATLTLRTRRLLRPLTHRLTLCHDPQSNRLNYTHRETR